MTAAKKYVPQYTVHDYQQWEGDWELWSGIPVSMSPGPFGPHQWAASQLLFEIRKSLEASKCSAKALAELDWIVSDDTVVRPDVLVLCGDVPEHHLRQCPELVAEIISESTEVRDRNFKRDLYDEQGVAVYLLLDPRTETLEIAKRDETGRWEHKQVSDEIEFTICEGCVIRLDRTKLFAH